MDIPFTCRGYPFRKKAGALVFPMQRQGGGCMNEMTVTVSGKEPAGRKRARRIAQWAFNPYSGWNGGLI